MLLNSWKPLVLVIYFKVGFNCKLDQSEGCIYASRNYANYIYIVTRDVIK